MPRPPDLAPEPWPRHLAVIMDGNGRWAAARGKPRVAGHRAGAEAVRRTVRAAAAWGVEALTLYAFSTENWTRPALEVRALMRLLTRFLESEVPELEKNGVRLRFLGDPERLSKPLRTAMRAATERLAVQRGLILGLAINYGGRDEIVRAARGLLADAAAGRLSPEAARALDETAFEARLDTAGLPPVDLVIRTAGEMRLSNFLPWQAAYAEYYACPTPWPDFDADALAEAIRAFQSRQRRFGGLP